MDIEQRPNIFLYHDLIQFLNDWIEFLRKTKKDFSIRNFSKSSGIAQGYMNMILSRDRTLTEKSFFKIVGYLELQVDERKFLNLLRIVSQSEEPKTRLEAVDEMIKFKKFKKSNTAEIKTYEYLTKWHYVAIYEMFNLTNFDPQPEFIQKRLKQKLNLIEIQQALDFLQEHKFIVQTQNGIWTQAAAFLDCNEGIYKISLSQFHRQMLDLAHDSISSTKREDRCIIGQTMAVNRENFDQIKKILQQAMNVINELNKNSSDKDNVYHIEVAAFPLLLKSEEK